MGNAKRALQSFVAGRHSSYATQFYRPHALPSFSSRAAMRKALSRKSLERRLVLPMAEGEWMRALEVLSAGYAKPSRTPEHFQRVIRLLIETETGVTTDEFSSLRGETTPGTSSSHTSYPFQVTRASQNDRSPCFSSSRAAFLIDPLDTLRDKAYAGDIPSNASLYITFMWAYCRIGAPFHAVETFFQCQRRMRLSFASRDHALDLLLPALCAAGARGEGTSLSRELSPSPSSTMLPSSLFSTITEVLTVAGVSFERYRKYLAEGAALDGNWKEALQWAPRSTSLVPTTGFTPPPPQEGERQMQHPPTHAEEEWDVTDQHHAPPRPQTEGKEVQEKEKQIRNEKEKTCTAWPRAEVLPVAPCTPPVVPLHLASPADASSRFVSPSQQEGGSPYRRAIQQIAMTLSCTAVENMLWRALQDAAEELGNTSMVWEEEEDGSRSSSWSSTTLPSALFVARTLWNTVFPHRHDVTLSEEVMYAMLNVLGTMSRRTSTALFPETERLARPPPLIHERWKELVYWVVHFFLYPAAVLPLLPAVSRCSASRDSSPACAASPPSHSSSSPWWMYPERYVPLEKWETVNDEIPSSSPDALPFHTGGGNHATGYPFSSHAVVEPSYTNTFPSFPAPVACAPLSSHHRGLTGAPLERSATCGAPLSHREDPVALWFHFPSPRQLAAAVPQEATLSHDTTPVPSSLSSSFSPATFPISPVVLNMVFGAYPTVTEYSEWSGADTAAAPLSSSSSSSPSFPFLLMAYPKSMIALLDDLLLHVEDMRLTPFVVSRVAPALLQLGATPRAISLLEEIISSGLGKRNHKTAASSSHTSMFKQESNTLREGHAYRRPALRPFHTSSPSPPSLQRTLLELLQIARACAPPLRRGVKSPRHHEQQKSGEEERKSRAWVSNHETSRTPTEGSVREGWPRDEAPLSHDILPSPTKKKETKDEGALTSSLFFPPPSSPFLTPAQRRVMAWDPEKEQRQEAVLKEQFLHFYQEKQGGQWRAPSPWNCIGKRRVPSAGWHPDSQAEEDPRPPPIGLHDTANGWNYLGRGGEKVFFNSRRTPHPFSMWPKVMRSLADPYRSWRPRENSSIGHRENVKKWNGRSSV